MTSLLAFFKLEVKGQGERSGQGYGSRSKVRSRSWVKVAINCRISINPNSSASINIFGRNLHKTISCKLRYPCICLTVQRTVENCNHGLLKKRRFPKCVYLILGLRSGIQYFSFYFMTLFSVTVTSAGLGFLFSSLFSVLQVTTLATSIVLIIMMVINIGIHIVHLLIHINRLKKKYYHYSSRSGGRRLRTARAKNGPDSNCKN